MPTVRLRPTWIALMMLSSSMAAAQTGSVQCAFSPHLTCSANKTIIWDNPRFADSIPFAMDNRRIYLSQNNTASSLDLSSGEVRWQLHTQDDARYFYPVLDDQHIYLARTDGKLEKHHAGSGELIWSHEFGAGWVYPPVLVENKVITAGQDRTLWLLDASSGDIQNEITLSQELVAPLFSINQQIFASTFDGLVSAYHINSTQADWQTHISSPVFAQLQYADTLINADMGGNLTALDTRTGAVLWENKIHTNAQYWNVIRQQKLYSLTDTGSLNILDANSGQLQSSLVFAKQFAQAPIVQGDSIALFDTEGSTLQVSFDELNKSQNKPSITFN